jgi:prepilin-type N-terminal cleavage/methylation domain-containing protein
MHARPFHSPARSGFTLVELAIVLVVVGLLIGGIVAGQSFIRSAGIRTAVADFQKHQAAVTSFVQKYNAIPGDMKTAQTYWGAATCPGTAGSQPTGVTATCNGNGDGVIDFFSSGYSGYENFRAWQHMANAGLIGGNYSGTAGTGGNRDSIPDQNVPASRLADSGFSIEWLGDIGAGDTWRWVGSYANAMYFGAAAHSAHPMESPIFTGTEAAGFDSKIDDGIPSTGRARSHKPIGGWLSCTTTNDPATTAYNLRSDVIACAMLFPNIIPY